MFTMFTMFTKPRLTLFACLLGLSLASSSTATTIDLTFDVNDIVIMPLPTNLQQFLLSSPVTPFTHIASASPEAITVDLSFINGSVVVTDAPGGPRLPNMGYVGSLFARDSSVRLNGGSSHRTVRFPELVGFDPTVGGAELGDFLRFGVAGWFGWEGQSLQFTQLQFENISTIPQDTVFDRFTLRIFAEDIEIVPSELPLGIPEPTTLSLMGLAFAALLFFRCS